MPPFNGRQLLIPALVLLGTGLIGQLCYRYVESTSLVSMEQVLDVQRAELDRQLDQLSFIARILADDVEIRNALSTPNAPNRQQASERLRKTQLASGLDFAFLLDPTGLTVASSNYQDSVSFVGISYSFRPYFKQAIQGQGATYFAVGATTGIPGYFIAWPVIEDDVVLGVVVTKMDLQVLVNTWIDKGYFSTLSDEVGVVILSTDERMLYTATRPISEAQRQLIELERRYTLNENVSLSLTDRPQQRLRLDDGVSTEYLFVEKPLINEPWMIATMLSKQRVMQSVAVVVSGIVAALLIVYLLVRVYSQQQRLMIAQKRSAQELEALVQERTAELASAQEQLIKESNFSMLGRMSAAINHEVNQPLASLRFNLASLRKLIAQKEPDQREIEQIVIDSDRTTKRIGRVINSLRSVANREKTQFVIFRLDLALIDVLQTIRRERPTLSACVSVSEQLPQVNILGEEVLIQQAILNLLYNAFDAVVAVETPAITIDLKTCSGDTLHCDRLISDRSYACVSVSDNGTGVDDDMVDSLFEPFASGRALVDGLGLGLTISLQIAHDHGGELLHRQPEANTGSRFMLILPYG